MNDIFRTIFIFSKVAFYVLDAALAAGIFYVVRQTRKLKPHFPAPQESGRKVLTARDAMFAARWREIEAKADDALPDAAKLAIIEADKFVDDLLKKMGLPGEHMADRLDNLADNEMRSIQKLWDAHRLRNNIVHTPGFKVSSQEARKAMEGYRAFLEELGIL
jgi:hypothetical protein